MREEEAKGVGGIAFEVGGYSVFCVESFEAVGDSFIVMGDMPTIQKNLLHLQSKFDDFDGRGNGFGDESSGASKEEFHEEAFEFGLYFLLG